MPVQPVQPGVPSSSSRPPEKKGLAGTVKSWFKGTPRATEGSLPEATLPRAKSVEDVPKFIREGANSPEIQQAKQHVENMRQIIQDSHLGITNAKWTLDKTDLSNLKTVQSLGELKVLQDTLREAARQFQTIVFTKADRKEWQGPERDSLRELAKDSILSTAIKQIDQLDTQARLMQTDLAARNVGQGLLGDVKGSHEDSSRSA